MPGFTFLTKLLLLCAGHALCDYPLQGEYLALSKNHTVSTGKNWPLAMFAHALIHAGMVYLITHSLWMAFAELAIHAVTDWSKCDGRIGSGTDQAIHYACKLLWAVL